MPPVAGPRPARKVSLARLVAATYFMVAGGPYGLENLIAGFGYRGALVALALTPLVWSLPTAFMVGELSSTLPEEGGYYVWCRRALGPFWGFYEAWLSLLASVFDMAIYPTLFALYLGRLWPAASGRGGEIAAGAALIAACTAWNLRGARAVGSGSVAFFLALAVPFGAMAAIGLAHAGPPAGAADAIAAATGPAAATSGAAAAAPTAAAGLTVAMWNYMGWDNAGTIAGEVERPHRTYPLAMLLALAAVAGSYLIAVAAVAHSGIPSGSWRTGSWVDAGERLGGRWLAIATAIGGMVSAAGMYGALTMSYSRLPMTLARDGFFPRSFARPNERTGAPSAAIIACSAAYALCLGLGFERLVDLDIGIYGLSLVIELVALAVLRVREPHLPRPFRVPGGWIGLAAVVALPTLLFGYAAVDASRESEHPLALASLTAAALLGGPLVYRCATRRLRPPRAPLPAAVLVSEIDREGSRPHP